LVRDNKDISFHLPAFDMPDNDHLPERHRERVRIPSFQHFSRS